MDKYNGYKDLTIDPKSENPFPLLNFSLFEAPSVDDFGFQSIKVYLLFGQGRFGTKYNTTYSFELTGITEEAIFKLVQTKNTPSARCGHTSTNEPINNKIYVFGGETSSFYSSFSNELYELDVSNFEWKLLKSGPSARAYHSMVSLNGNLYVFGGNDSDKFYGDLWEYSIEKNEWKKIEFKLRPSPRISPLLFAHENDNSLYLIGGARDSYSPEKDIWKFNIKEQTWTQIYVKQPSNQPLNLGMSLPARNASGWKIGTKIIIYGGETLVSDDNEVETFMNDILIFDLETSELSKCGDIQNYPIFCHQMHLFKDRFLFFGGSYDSIISFHYVSMIQFDDTFIGKRLLEGNIYGVSLEKVMKRKDHEGLKYPRIFKECIDYLNGRSMDLYDGIFRKSGRHIETLQLCTIFENCAFFDPKKFKDPNCIAVALKKYLSSLPEPLLTYSLYSEFINCSTIDEIKKVMLKLPKVNYEMAKDLFLFLYKVDENQKVTLMHADNLKIILGTTLLKNNDYQVQNEKKEISKQNVMVIIIKNAPTIFQ